MAAVPDTDTDELLRRAGAGDSAAGGRLLDRHRPRLVRLVELRMDRRLAARVDASDVVQDTLLEAARRLPEYLRERPLPFYPWVRQLALDQLGRQHRQHVRARRRSVLREQPQAASLLDRSAVALAAKLAAGDTAPGDRLVRAERVAEVRAALDRLDPPDRDVLVLRFVEQLSTQDTAAVLGLTADGAKSRQRRALERLSRLLGDLAGDDERV
jgi:RNA polymerase sigma-70 factor (ECF subfamily)